MEILGAVLCLIGIINLFVSFSIVVKLFKRRNCKFKAIAEVVRVDTVMGDIDSCDKFIPTLEFQVDDKIVTNKVDSADVSVNKIDVGQAFTVLYNEKNPNEFYIYNSYENKSVFLFYLITALIIIAVGLVLIF